MYISDKRPFICRGCDKAVEGVTYINGVPYCPMCASVINKNNAAIQKGTLLHNLLENNNVCQGCSNNPKNGGSGICHCILGQKVFY